MNDADSTPSPKRFCRKFGIRIAALNAPAAFELPKKWANAFSRTRPAMRLRRMPDATSMANPARGFGLSAGAPDAAIVAIVSVMVGIGRVAKWRPTNVSGRRQRGRVAFSSFFEIQKPSGGVASAREGAPRGKNIEW